MEDLIRRIRAIDESAVSQFDNDAFDWERGMSLDAGRKKLRDVLAALSKTRGK
jgi:hypothetical protein